VTYQDYAQSLAPVWLRGEAATTEIRARAAPLDDLVLRLRTLMLARLIGDAPEEPLMMIGSERGIRRFPSEPLSTYRRRVAGAWRWWTIAGTLPGMVELLELSGYAATVTEHFRDPDQPHWAEFSIHVVPLRPLIKDAIWGAQNDYSDAETHWGYRIDGVPVSSLVELVREIKPAHARLRRLTFATGRGVWGGSDTWGDGAVIGERHGWGYPWGMPSATSQTTGDADLKWGDGQFQVIYDINGGIT